jgi:hypothetical protein
MKIQRADIHLISKNSNWSQTSVEAALKENVFTNRTSWKKFLQYAFLILAIGFTLAGIIFFFAYNWSSLNKFFKFGLMQAILVLTVFLSVFIKFKQPVFRNIILTTAAILVGVSFALFGQIYQTGANAYDFFLAWLVFIFIWTLISGFSVLWLLFIVLLNITINFYAQQVAYDWLDVFVCLLLFVLDSTILIVTQYISARRGEPIFPFWFSDIILVGAAYITTVGFALGLFDDKQKAFYPLVLITLFLYTIGFRKGLKEKKISYLAIILFSVIIMGALLIGKLTETLGKDYSAWLFLFNSLYVVISVGYLIKYLITIQKRWKRE